MEQALITGVAHERGEAKVTVTAVPDHPGRRREDLPRPSPTPRSTSTWWCRTSPAAAEGKTDITFTLPKGDGPTAVDGARGPQGRDRVRPDRLQRPRRQGVADRRRHALAPGRDGDVLRGAGRGRGEHRHHLHLGDPDLGAGRATWNWTRRCGRCTRHSTSAATKPRPSCTRDREMTSRCTVACARRRRRRDRAGRRRDAPDPGGAQLPGRADPVLRLRPVGRARRCRGRRRGSSSRTPRPPTRPGWTSRCSPPAPPPRGRRRRGSPRPA